MRWCPYCAAEIKRGAMECPGCGKKVGNSQSDQEQKAGLTSRDAYEKKVVPVWLFILIVAFFVFMLALIFV